MSDIKLIKRAETNIDWLMLEKGIKNDVELAEKLELSQQTLSARLNGNISLKTLKSLAEFFEVPVKEMFR